MRLWYYWSYILTYCVSFIVLHNHLAGEERAGCFTFLRSEYHAAVIVRSLTLHHGDKGWSVVCDCGISWSYSITF